ncbi:MAG: MFS transporter [Aquisalimonadaceae bacterium]
MPPSADRNAPAGTNWLRVAIVVFAGVAAALHIGKVPPAIPLFQAELNLSLLATGWIMSFLAVAGASSGIAAGMFVSRVGQRHAIILGLGLLVAGSLIGAAAIGPGSLLLARGIESCGLILVVVAAPGLIAHTATAGDQRVALSMWGGWQPLGIALMMLASALFLDVIGWRTSWLLAAGVTVLAGILMVRNFPARAPVAPAASSTPGFRDLRDAASQPGPWLLALIFFFYSSSFLTLFGYLPTFLVETGVSPMQATVMTALAVFCNALGSLAGGVLARHGWQRWQLIAIASLTMAATSYGIFSDDLPTWMRYVLSMAFSLTGGLIPATIFGSIALFASRPGHFNSINGMIVHGVYTGQLIGPPILAFLVGATGGWNPAAPIFLGTTGLAAFTLSLFLRWNEKKSTVALSPG